MLSWGIFVQLLLLLSAGVAVTNADCQVSSGTCDYFSNSERCEIITCEIIMYNQLDEFFAHYKYTGSKSLKFILTDNKMSMPFRLSRKVFHGFKFKYVDINYPRLESIDDDTFEPDYPFRIHIRRSAPDVVNLAALLGPQTYSLFLDSCTWFTAPVFNCGDRAVGPAGFQYILNNTLFTRLPAGFWNCSVPEYRATINNQGPPLLVSTLVRDTFILFTAPKRETNMDIELYSGYISHIEKGFINTSRLPRSSVISVILNLHNNMMKDFEEEVFGPLLNNPNLKMYIIISGNPISCCDMRWLFKTSHNYNRNALSGSTCKCKGKDQDFGSFKSKTDVTTQCCPPS